MGLSRADSMVGVLVDACGWVSLVDAGLNLDISLNKTIGEAELKITDSVRRELDSLAGSRGGAASGSPLLQGRVRKIGRGAY
ncbi:MAG: hypothetical protein CM15mP105_0770 [Methanobacteriota archaeon]|nr:MAG: hypothetical protein CM15mP105_0770 [Euryarchaeota archaeon]